MTSSPKYSRAPIAEAILDVRVNLSGEIKLTDLKKCQFRVEKDYPQVEDTRFHTGQFLVGPESASTSVTTRPVGFTFTSADKLQLFSVSKEGFSFHRMAPYTGWENFVGEAKRLWEEYRRVAHPREYTRVALRTINKFVFTAHLVEMTDYFRTHPEISPDLPQLMAESFFRVVVPLEPVSSGVIITLTSTNLPAPGGIEFLLDIDLIRSDDLPSGPDLWPLFETLREWKNKVFEACITEKTREMIR